MSYTRTYTNGKPEEYTWTYDAENEWWNFHQRGYKPNGSGLSRMFFDQFRTQHEKDTLGRSYARITIEYPDYYDDGPDCD
jgi:hypothetical protein